jgi:hypothetical protein
MSGPGPLKLLGPGLELLDLPLADEEPLGVLGRGQVVLHPVPPITGSFT